jgi:putative FmdB family regulatory protein
MPFYEYQCSNCGHSLEAMQKISDPPLKKCPHCGKPQLQKLMSAPVFRLKGGGWYETDFKSDQDNKRNLADRPEAEAPKEEKKDKAESKEATATETAKAEKPAGKAAPDSKQASERPAGRGAPAKKPSSRKKATSRPSRPAAKRTRARSAGRR